MAPFNWIELLTQWSAAVLADDESTEDLPAEVITSGWLGYPGATEAQITAAEIRLGTRLPPSYREFLKVSNGWRDTSFIYEVWSAEEIAWFAVRHRQWIDIYVRGAAHRQHMPDQAYLVYGTQQNPLRFRAEYLQTALEISARGDSAIYLLNPQIVTPEGEWEAWFFANWLPGVRRYRSFWELMQGELDIFRRTKEA